MYGVLIDRGRQPPVRPLCFKRVPNGATRRTQRCAIRIRRGPGICLFDGRMAHAHKRLVEKATGVSIPAPDEAVRRVKPVLPKRFKFKADGYIPNNPRLDALFYRNAFRFERSGDPAALIEAVFNANGWSKAWRNGSYDFVHYHPRTHEVLGVARGWASLRIGGNHGTTIRVRAGDVLLVPAGVGHECLKANPQFLVVGLILRRASTANIAGASENTKRQRGRFRGCRFLRRTPCTGAIFQGELGTDLCEKRFRKLRSSLVKHPRRCL